ncbi:FAD:protein FMN transferase [Antarcticibacterium sp. 1MA-6-2]|uniref:FAD:protein FMN transferase n=1 Tax=Antarcticibacterium sp. 1MA-6-2 TaxID=2908210 RepID=UPI00288326D5|nr:FAD:protein FMN transferase [Antarcticibacterium sp. 1MA-6-2]
MTDFRKLSKLFFSGFFIILFLACNSQESKEQIYSGEALGTSYQIKFFYPEELELQESLDSIFRNINESMSTYQDNSDISRINAGDTTIMVDENFRKVFMDSYQIYIKSRGFFDPTVGNLVNAYGFGPESGEAELDQEEVDSMLQYVGFNKLKLSNDNHIIKDHPEIYLDFNAIAKGYTVDVLASYLESKGVEDILVEVGGELVAKGKNLGKDFPWTVGIDDPLQVEGKRSLTAALRLENRAMATSGNYRKFRVDSN